MEIEIKIDGSCREPKVIILTYAATEEVKELIRRLSVSEPQVITGFCNDTLEILEQADIIRIYASDGKVYAKTHTGEYVLRLRLYELESRLDKGSFVRISNSEIINLKKVKKFDLSFVGTICVSLSDNTVSYVSRRYVAKIKHILGI